MGWTIGGWLVPVLNLFRPKQIANDLWRAGDVQGGPDVSALVTWWWLTFLVSGWGSRSMFGNARDPAEGMGSSLTANAVWYLVGAAAAALAIAFVRGITHRMDRAAGLRAQALIGGPPADESGGPNYSAAT